jgi:hypothetical protein
MVFGTLKVINKKNNELEEERISMQQHRQLLEEKETDDVEDLGENIGVTFDD